MTDAEAAVSLLATIPGFMAEINLTSDAPVIGTEAQLVEFGANIGVALIEELRKAALSQGGTARRHKRNPATTTRDLAS